MKTVQLITKETTSKLMTSSLTRKEMKGVKKTRTITPKKDDDDEVFDPSQSLKELSLTQSAIIESNVIANNAEPVENESHLNIVKEEEVVLEQVSPAATPIEQEKDIILNEIHEESQEGSNIELKEIVDESQEVSIIRANALICHFSGCSQITMTKCKW